MASFPGCRMAVTRDVLNNLDSLHFSLMDLKSLVTIFVFFSKEVYWSRTNLKLSHYEMFCQIRLSFNTASHFWPLIYAFYTSLDACWSDYFICGNVSCVTVDGLSRQPFESLLTHLSTGTFKIVFSPAYAIFPLVSCSVLK